MQARQRAQQTGTNAVEVLTVFIFPFWPACSFQASPGLGPADFGGHSEGETPLPIPNRAVKPLSADGTWRATAWESRSPPVLYSQSRLRAALFVLGAGMVAALGRVALDRGAKVRARWPRAREAPLVVVAESSAGSRSRVLPHRRCGGSSPAPPIRAGDRVWDAGRSAGERTPPRLVAQGRTRQAWRSRSRGRHRRRLAGQGRCARGTWPAIYERPRTEHMFCKGCCRGPRRGV